MAPPKEEPQKSNKKEQHKRESDTLPTDEENDRYQRAWRAMQYGISMDASEDDWGDGGNEMTKKEFWKAWDDWIEEGRAWKASGEDWVASARAAKAAKVAGDVGGDESGGTGEEAGRGNGSCDKAQK